jgi:hypothetical protein
MRGAVAIRAHEPEWWQIGQKCGFESCPGGTSGPISATLSSVGSIPLPLAAVAAGCYRGVRAAAADPAPATDHWPSASSRAAAHWFEPPW